MHSIISNDIFISYFKFKSKAYRMLRGTTKNEQHEYISILEQQKKNTLNNHIKKLKIIH